MLQDQNPSESGQSALEKRIAMGLNNDVAPVPDNDFDIEELISEEEIDELVDRSDE